MEYGFFDYLLIVSAFLIIGAIIAYTIYLSIDKKKTTELLNKISLEHSETKESTSSSEDNFEPPFKE